jgi:hypothetical protein
MDAFNDEDVNPELHEQIAVSFSFYILTFLVL